MHTVEMYGIYTVEMYLPSGRYWVHYELVQRQTALRLRGMSAQCACADKPVSVELSCPHIRKQLCLTGRHFQYVRARSQFIPSVCERHFRISDRLNQI